MLTFVNEEIANLIEDQGRDLKFKLNDKLDEINFDCTPSISYDYLLTDSKNEYSFLNPEINELSSEEFPNLSDSQIYFQKIQEICKNNFGALTDECVFFKTINPNRELKKVVDFIFSTKLQADQTPTFVEIKLYTNKVKQKSPRVFGFIGNASIIYVLFYDPFHKIYSATGRI